MKIVRIIADPKPTLYAIQYENEESHELERVFEELNDTEVLHKFFSNHKADLKQYGKQRYTIQEAIKKTLDDVYKLEQQLFDLAEHGHDNPGEYLQTLFEPLRPDDTRLYALQKSKTKPHRKSWIRLYAIRIAEHLYVITGGTIKLTWYMNEREHTKLELQKMDRVVEYLKAQGLINKRDFKRLELGL